ncbi:MAG: heparan-alpha-glucosaminide N-acetyltransferase domain-containing protein [Cryomorphaceae bacterium]|nr:heparan-alpha-glucosaminide N-acetyltransferase domain-containing protein [Cryomorphaceae bacterium]
MKRDSGIDVMRTIAIWVMLCANAAPYLCPENYPFSFRLICSAAAPLFLFLAGYSFGMTHSSGKGSKFNGLYIIASAVIVDVCAWGIPPFVTFDVLYAIGFSLLFLELSSKIQKWILPATIAIVILSLPFILPYYRFYNPEPDWSDLTPDLKRLFIDGWFPLLPWILFPVIGNLTFTYRSFLEKKSAISLVLSFFALIAGIVFCYFFKSTQLLREGYTEFFYPADFTYLLFAVSGCLFLYLILLKVKPLGEAYTNLLVLGRHSLFVYILHSFLISFVIDKLNLELSFSNFAIVMVAFFTIVYLLTFALEWMLKNGTLKMLPKWVRKPLGLY